MPLLPHHHLAALLPHGTVLWQERAITGKGDLGQATPLDMNVIKYYPWDMKVMTDIKFLHQHKPCVKSTCSQHISCQILTLLNCSWSHPLHAGRFTSTHISQVLWFHSSLGISPQAISWPSHTGHKHSHAGHQHSHAGHQPSNTRHQPSQTGQQPSCTRHQASCSSALVPAS